MMRMMIYGMRRTMIRFRCLTLMGLVALAMVVAVTDGSAQSFEEVPVAENDNGQTNSDVPGRIVQSETFVTQPLPAVLTPGDVSLHRRTAGIVQPVGDTSQGQVVLAQYQSNDTRPSSSAVTLPSVRLTQGDAPRLAYIEKASPQTSVYQGPGRIITGESDGMTPTVTTRPLMPGPPITGNQRPALGSGVVNAFTQPDEIEWDNVSTPPEYDSYEPLPKQLNRNFGSAFPTQDLYVTQEYDGLYGSPYGNPFTNPYDGLYGQGIADNGGIYTSNGYYGYGLGVSGYGYGGYPGAYPPMYSHNLVSGALGFVLCSNVWENMTIGFGGTGFKSPLDFQNGGAFGFTETLNWASPSSSMLPVRLQAGVRAVQAYPSGYRDDLNTWHENNREQYFGTAGVFKRNIGCSPFSFGVAYDIMSDNYYDKYRLEQLRGELSYSTMYGVEFGYRGAFGLRNDSVWLYSPNRQRADVRVVDYHTLFLKKFFTNGGEGSLAGGATEYGDMMIRAEYSIPISNEWGLKNSLSYIVPKGGHSAESPLRESWDVSLQLVYQPRGGMLAGFCNPFRTFFDVADNGTMLRRFK